MAETLMHRCAAIGCSAQIPSIHLMCPGHWKKVPRYLQQIIWSNFRRRTFFAEYQKAVEQARQIVASYAGAKPAQRVRWQDVLRPGEFRTRPKTCATTRRV